MKRLLLILLLPIIGFGQPNYTVTINNNAAAGNLFFLTGGPPIKPVNIVDGSGSLIFSEFWPMKGFDWKVNKNNHLTYFDRSTKAWFVMDSLYNVVDSVYCQNGHVADNHDFIALPNGNYVLIAYDEQPYAMDTIVVGGDPNALVEGFIIQELDANHNLIFEWRSWDYFHVTDNTYLDLTNSNLQFIHGNAIDIDFDGHFLISSRALDEITKINRTTGEIIWRWGGSQNEFTIIGNDYPFSHQHCIRSLGNNRYLLYDNGNYSAQYTASGNNISRAVEYVIDTNAMTVEKVWEFIHPNSLYAPSTGGVQRLSNGNTLINWGNMSPFGIGAIITEVDVNGQIVFELECVPGENVYRAHKFDWFFDDSIVGCLDPVACNYNPNIIISDSSSCNYNSYSYDTLISNNVILWNGMYLGASGDYSYTLLNSSGCDSIAYINLVINLTGTYNMDINRSKILIKVVDALGREVQKKENRSLFYIYEDGIVEKRIIIEQ